LNSYEGKKHRCYSSDHIQPCRKKFPKIQVKKRRPSKPRTSCWGVADAVEPRNGRNQKRQPSTKSWQKRKGRKTRIKSRFEGDIRDREKIRRSYWFLPSSVELKATGALPSFLKKNTNLRKMGWQRSESSKRGRFAAKTKPSADVAANLRRENTEGGYFGVDGRKGFLLCQKKNVAGRGKRNWGNSCPDSRRLPGH